jgi:hypothetical protein
VFVGINPCVDRSMNLSATVFVAAASACTLATATAQVASPHTAAPAWHAAAPAWAAPSASAASQQTQIQRQTSAARAPADANDQRRRSVLIALPQGQPLAGAALQRANQTLLIEARTPDRRSPAAAPAKPRDLARSGALDGSLAPGMCARPGWIAGPRGQFTPGGLIVARGCRLGDRRGEVHILGAFPGGRVVLDVVEWTDRMVAAEIPGELKGVVDQDTQLLLILADGQRSNERPMRFQARRETVALPDHMASRLNCAHPQPSGCYIDGPLLTGWHYGDDSQGGRDTWGLVLGSSWAVGRIDYEKRVGDVQASVRKWTTGQQLLSVDWRSQLVGPGNTSSEYHAMYSLRLFVTGPVGVPLTADQR